VKVNCWRKIPKDLGTGLGRAGKHRDQKGAIKKTCCGIVGEEIKKANKATCELPHEEASPITSRVYQG